MRQADALLIALPDKAVKHRYRHAAIGAKLALLSKMQLVLSVPLQRHLPVTSATPAGLRARTRLRTVEKSTNGRQLLPQRLDSRIALLHSAPHSKITAVDRSEEHTSELQSR